MASELSRRYKWANRVVLNLFLAILLFVTISNGDSVAIKHSEGLLSKVSGMAPGGASGRGFGMRTPMTGVSSTSPATKVQHLRQQPSEQPALLNSKSSFPNRPTSAVTTYQATTSTLPLPPSEELTQTEADDKFLYDWEAILLKKLFAKTSYNNDVRPARSNVEPVHVTLELVLLQINDLVDKEQQIVISGFLKINWDDERLAWNPEQFGNIEWIVTSARNVWLPDIALINSDDVYAVTRDGRFPVTITSNGQILYVPAGKIHARCELDLRFFPFDDQLCTYRFESWVYAAELVQINGINFTIDRNHYVDNHQWEIRDSFVHTRIVNYETYNFSRVEFFMLLRRKSLFFITYTIFPCLALSTLQIFSHMLPFTESERINFATTTLIAFSVFHVSIVEQMPQSSHAIPLLAIYIDALMCLIGLSLLECFLMMNWLSKVGCSVPNPRIWYYVVDKWGDYMMLGSNGTYWRRNYLRILEEVNAKECADARRKVYERKRWKSTSRKHQESYIRKWSNFGAAQEQNSGEIDALICLMNRWGYSFGGHTNNHSRRQRTAGVSTSEAQQQDAPITCSGDVVTTKHRARQPSFRNVDEVDKYSTPLSSVRHSNVHAHSVYVADDQPSTSVGFVGGTRRPRFESEEDQPAERHSSTDSVNRSQLSSLTRRQNNNVDPLNKPRSMELLASRSEKPVKLSSHHSVNLATTSTPSAAARTSSNSNRSYLRRQQEQADGSLDDDYDDSVMSATEPGPSSSRQLQRHRFSKPSAMPPIGGAGSGSMVSFNVETRQCETRLATPQLRDRSRCDSCQRHHQQQNRSTSQQQQVVMQNPAPAVMQDKQMQLTTLDDIRQLIDDVNSSLSSHTLRRECIGVWTTFITVIDRIMSLILMVLCILMPTYLFVIFPKPMDLTNLKISQNTSNFDSQS